jgi:hypothetical protein
MIDEVDALLKTTLAAQCPRVARLIFRGKAGTYITYQLVLLQDRDAADDDMQGTEYTYRVDIYSKRDYIALATPDKAGVTGRGLLWDRG